MRSHEGSVGEGQGRDDEEEDQDAAQARKHVGPGVDVVVSEKGGDHETADGQHQDGQGVGLVKVVQGDLVRPFRVGCSWWWHYGYFLNYHWLTNYIINIISTCD